MQDSRLPVESRILEALIEDRLRQSGTLDTAALGYFRSLQAELKAGNAKHLADVEQQARWAEQGKRDLAAQQLKADLDKKAAADADKAKADEFKSNAEPAKERFSGKK